MTDDQMTKQMTAIIRDIEIELNKARGDLVYCITYINTMGRYNGHVGEKDIENLIPKLQQVLDIVKRVTP